MNRRGFLEYILAAAAAPAIVRAGSLMAVRPLIRITEMPYPYNPLINQIKAEILAHCFPNKVLLGQLIDHGIIMSSTHWETKNPGDTIVVRRFLPFSAIAAVPREPQT